MAEANLGLAEGIAQQAMPTGGVSDSLAGDVAPHDVGFASQIATAMPTRFSAHTVCPHLHRLRKSHTVWDLGRRCGTWADDVGLGQTVWHLGRQCGTCVALGQTVWD